MFTSRNFCSACLANILKNIVFNISQLGHYRLIIYVRPLGHPMMVGKSFVLLRVLFYPLPLTVHGERLMFLCLLSIHALSVHPLTSVPHDVISLHLVAQVITM